MTESPLGIVELLTAIGDENIRFQNLAHCCQGADRKKNGVMVYRFGSEVPMEHVLLDKPTKIGFIVWLDKAQVDRVMAEHKTGEPK